MSSEWELFAFMLDGSEVFARQDGSDVLLSMPDSNVYRLSVEMTNIIGHVFESPCKVCPSGVLMSIDFSDLPQISVLCNKCETKHIWINGNMCPVI
jgi:hypothetical protein